MSLSRRLDTVEHKLKQLAAVVDLLRQENEKLNIENKQLKITLARQDAKVSELKERLEQTQGLLNGQQSESINKLRSKIDQYVEEIDKCLEWLQNA